MTINEILKENIEFNNWKTVIENSIKYKQESIKELNENLNLEEFKTLSYENAKNIFSQIRWNLESNLVKQIESILQQIKEETYPMLKKAHFYPVINNIEFLTDKEKHNLDELLYKLGKFSYIHTCSSSWYNLNFDDNKTQQVLDFLYENNIIEKNYRLLCGCRSDGETLSEEEYNNHKKFFEIETKLGNEYGKESTATDEEYNWYYEFMEERLWSVGCFECDGRELESWDDFKEYTLMYKVKAMADMTYYSK